MRHLTVFFVVAALATVAPAAISYDIAHIVPAASDIFTDNFGIDLEADYMANLFTVTTDTDWLSCSLLVVPTEPGSIFQYPASPWDASEESPSQDVIDNGFDIPFYGPSGPLPALYYDTYLSTGVLGEPVDTPGPAVDLGGDLFVKTFDVDKLDIVWNTLMMDDIGALDLAMVTLKNTATGYWRFRASAAPAGVNEVWEMEGIIEGGMLVPEPASMSLLVLGGLGLLARRRRR